MSRVVALFCWAELTWTLLSFTATAGSIAAGIAISAVVRPRADRLRDRLAAVATGSVNDYALYLALGLAAVCGALLAF